MTTANLVQHIPANYKEASPSIFAQFAQWTKAQEPNRLLWLGIILAAHGAFLTPLTVMSVFLIGGGHLSLVVLAIAAMALVLVTNLAAQPTKVTIPAFLVSVVIDIAIFTTCIIQAFMQ